jgi:Fur family transcriptional regulator, peroxide stress response regulator
MKKTKTDIDRSLRRSRQRERILEVLRETESHPTADWVYAKLKREFPRLSLGTVYRNLSVLSEQGLVKKIPLGSTFDRFEANVGPHYHLICESCSRILDFLFPGYEELNRKADRMTDFSIRHHRIEFFGTCSDCHRKEDSR